MRGALLPGFTGTTLPSWLERRLREGLGGVCLFGQNIVSAAQLRELTDAILAANPDAIIAIDEEGGDVTRLHHETGSPYPGNAVLGRIGDLEVTERVGRAVGRELRDAGVNLDLAPDVDINSNPDNPVIGVRSFGASPRLVAEHGAAWIRGLQSQGVAACAKHFPGHGDTAQDSHLALPVVDLAAQTLRDRELVPFRAAIEAGVRTVMTSHILLPHLDAAMPATFSSAIIQGVLRGELGFDGVVVTDALDMRGASAGRGIPEAAVLALLAGCDLLCLGTGNTESQLDEIEAAIETAVRSGWLAEERVTEAIGRVRALAAGLAGASDETSGAEETEAAVPVDDVDRVLRTFDLSPAAHEWLRDAPVGYAVVRIDTAANIAVGHAPWGPFAEAAASPQTPAARAFSAGPLVSVSEHGEGPALAASLPVLVVGKDNHRHAFAREAIESIRAGHDRVMVVDMGWPSGDRCYADIATFGASRLVGRALLELLGRRS